MPDGSGGITVRVPYSSLGHTVEVVGIDGRVVARRTGNGAGTCTISSIRARGLYLVNVVCGTGKYSRVVLIKK